ncbi:MAG: hypothetical protein JWO31_34 [Phycisphaerales bacterium]|nr:hypothetical protein [Phycisphaerales bacterium]
MRGKPTRPDTARPSETRRPKSAIYDHYASLPPDTDFRAHPELYRVGRGEQGVLMVEPYKSELLPLWKFATPAAATESAAALEERFAAYLRAGDFVGADMARKFIQMGHTRARRYTNYAGGRKYKSDGFAQDRSEPDAEKAESALIFAAAWKRVREDAEYLAMKRKHQKAYG